MNSSTLATAISNTVSFYGEDVVLAECDKFYCTLNTTPDMSIADTAKAWECSIAEVIADLPMDQQMLAQPSTLVCTIVNYKGESEGGLILSSTKSGINCDDQDDYYDYDDYDPTDMCGDCPDCGCSYEFCECDC